MFCHVCGAENPDGAEFCSKCGTDLRNKNNNKSDKTNANKVSNKNNTESKNLINKLFMKKDEKTGEMGYNTSKIIFIIIVLISIGLIVISVSTGSVDNAEGNWGYNFNKNLVDITSVSISSDSSYNPKVHFRIMPKETINRVIGIGVKNVEITYGDGKTFTWDYLNFKTYKNTYSPNKEYGFVLNLNIADDFSSDVDTWNAYNSISHVKADIIVNTTSETNMVIGHIDTDITPKHKDFH